MPSVFKIVPGIQSYAWGKKGSSSLAAQLASVSVPGFEVDEDKTYAELWMGTHTTLPSKVDGKDLSTVLEEDPSLIGKPVINAFPDAAKGALPFLFKVLSIGTALSIQAHPGKKLAEQLHAERGNIYKDPNHKPEMAIALTPFTAFLNFLPLQSVLLHLLSVPELEQIIPAELTSELARSLLLPDTRPADPLLFTPVASSPNDEQKGILKKIFGALMSSSEETYQKAIRDLLARYETGDIRESEKDLVELAKTLNEQYPDDIGVLCVFLLNVVELKKGEAAFLGADMPHAYISGDIIECMATSDNVVRAGLTPKLRDVDTLVSMLTYEAGPGSKQLLKPEKFDDYSLLYDPPIDEFSVLKINVDSASQQQKAIEGPSLCVVTVGEGKVAWGEDSLDIVKGDVVFIGADTPVTWSSEASVEVFRAYVEASKQ